MAQIIIEGEYYLSKMEMAGGFNFTKDGTFQFFFSYGAVDRNAEGTFVVEGNTIKLISHKEAGKDFSVTSESKIGKGYHIQCRHANAYLVEKIKCIFHTKWRKHEILTNSKGEVHADLKHCNTIFAQHVLYPDIATCIKEAGNENNNFTIALHPTLEQVSFKETYITIIDEKTLALKADIFYSSDKMLFTKKQ